MCGQSEAPSPGIWRTHSILAVASWLHGICEAITRAIAPSQRHVSHAWYQPAPIQHAVLTWDSIGAMIPVALGKESKYLQHYAASPYVLLQTGSYVYVRQSWAQIMLPGRKGDASYWNALGRQQAQFCPPMLFDKNNNPRRQCAGRSGAQERSTLRQVLELHLAGRLACILPRVAQCLPSWSACRFQLLTCSASAEGRTRARLHLSRAQS